MSKIPQAGIIAIGRELLTGRVLDTNTNYMAKGLFDAGIRLQKACVVDDNLSEVCKALHFLLSENVDVIITSGGLGPTYDDGTIGFIASCLGLRLRKSELALDMIRRRYKEVHLQRPEIEPDLNLAREKMAMFPEGSTELFNPVGTAPGMELKYNLTHIFALPGPPKELHYMFDNYVLPYLRSLSKGRGFFRKQVTVPLKDESRLDPLISELRVKYPDIYFKTVPKGFQIEGMDIVLETYGQKETALSLLNTAATSLVELVKKML